MLADLVSKEFYVVGQTVAEKPFSTMKCSKRKMYTVQQSKPVPNKRSWEFRCWALKYSQHQLCCTAASAFLISVCSHVLLFVLVIWSQVANQQVVHHYFQIRRCGVAFSCKQKARICTSTLLKLLISTCQVIKQELDEMGTFLIT